MTFAGLPETIFYALLAGAGGAVTILYLLKLRRRRVLVPFSPLWAKVVPPIPYRPYSLQQAGGSTSPLEGEVAAKRRVRVALQHSRADRRAACPIRPSSSAVQRCG